MRHAQFVTEHGTKFCQVLLYVLLHTWLCHGRVFVNTQKRWYFTDTRSQKDSTKMGPYQSSRNNDRGRTTSLPPVIMGMGFLPRNHINNTEDIPPDVVNVTLVTNPPTLDAKIWNALLSKYKQSKNKTSMIGNSSEESSQLDIPHLVRLGYGVAKVENRENGNIHDPVSEEKVTMSSKTNIKHYIVIGAGSFIGGMTVILMIIFILLLRKRWRRPEIITRDAETAMHDDTKPLLDFEEDIDRRDSGVDVTNELSTSTSSSNSNPVDSSSNSSDNVSHISSVGEVWSAPDHIALSTLQQHEFTHSMENISLLSLEDRESPPSRRSSTTIPSALFQYDIPDLLLYSSPPLVIPPTIPEYEPDCGHSEDGFQSSNDSLQQIDMIGEEGGIVRCQGTDVVMVIPPGAVSGDKTYPVTIQQRDHEYLNDLRKNELELILSPVMELMSPKVDFFREPIALKFPFRSISRSTDCACEDDPLCGCANNAVELRYCDTSTSSYGSKRWTSSQIQVASVGHYSWPACLHPESDAMESRDNTICLPTENLQRSHVTFRCSDSVCCVRTNRPGFYALVWQPKHDIEYIPPLDFRMNNAEPTVRMCIAVGARYARDGHIPGEMFENTSSQKECIIYTVYIGDNTTCARMAIGELIRTSGSHQQCDCSPVDVTVSSEVKVTLASAGDVDWPLEIPYESTTKVIPWRSICRDFGTINTVEFHCSPKFGKADMDRGNVITEFDVSVTRHGGRDDDSVITVVADGPIY